ncbi:MAG: aldolase catalytic domain-containing protein [Clostridia bacterium]|nr:aldolase catalytic domain-containing protein [Clostridia bacterium]
MIQRKGTVLSSRNDIKVFDVTVRDGGLCNDFAFTDEFVRALYQANLKCGVDYMEFGYRADKRILEEAKFGKWKFCREEDLRTIVGNNDTDLKIAVMADVGKCNYKADFLPKSESVIDMVRVACYADQIPTAIEMIEHLHALGYETACNIMAISKVGTAELSQALTLLCHSPVDVIYLVDSFGALYPENACQLSKLCIDAVKGTQKKIGFHAHNNQNLAFANTVETLSCGVSHLDATVQSLGRGAGNCALELLLGFLKNPKYSFLELLKFIETYIPALKAESVCWGYDLQYMFTGLLNRHPREAIEFTANKRSDYFEFYRSLLEHD